MNRIILTLLLIIGCFYLTSTVNTKAGTMMMPNSCTDAQCQEEDNCDDCALQLEEECWWDEQGGGECRNPGACCFEEGDIEPVIICEVVSGFNCPNELQGEYFGDGVSCEEITCGEEEPPAGPIVIVPTMTQWGIIFASIVLGAIGIVAIIRERNIEKYMD